MASASTLPITRQRPPLPPNRTSCSQMKPEDFAAVRMKRFHEIKLQPKPHVMHRNCKNVNADDEDNAADVCIVFSSQCHVSKEWSQYISNLMKNHGYSKVISQDVETLSLLASRLNGEANNYPPAS